MNYNLGSKDITIGDINTKVNDGYYHVVRFSRSDINSTLQVDDNPTQTRNPQGNTFFPFIIKIVTVRNHELIKYFKDRYKSIISRLL